MLNRLLKISGIVAAIGVSTLNFEQMVIKYPEVKVAFPILLEDIRSSFAVVSRTTATTMSMSLRHHNLELVGTGEIETITSDRLQFLVDNLKPGEGSPIGGDLPP